MHPPACLACNPPAPHAYPPGKLRLPITSSCAHLMRTGGCIHPAGPCARVHRQCPMGFARHAHHTGHGLACYQGSWQKTARRQWATGCGHAPEVSPQLTTCSQDEPVCTPCAMLRSCKCARQHQKTQSPLLPLNGTIAGTWHQPVPSCSITSGTSVLCQR